MNPLIINLIANQVLPEAIGFIREYVRQRNGQWPTSAEVMAGLPRLADIYIDEGEAWLNRDKPASNVGALEGAFKEPKKRKPRKKKTPAK